jgi:3-hydroxyisobutyrate dehydrogenase
VDAPVLGGPEVTANGQARLLLGGQEQVVKGLDGLWGDISSGYTYCGPNGSATSMKLLSNLILIGGTMLLSEAVVTAQANGVENRVLQEVFGTSPAVAPGVRVRLADIMHGEHEGWWTIQLAEKDLGLALQLASSRGIDLPLGKTAEQVLQRTDVAGYGELDLGAVVEAVRGREAARSGT